VENLEFWSGLSTLATLVAFVAVVVWVMAGKRKNMFNDAANLPLEEDDMSSTQVKKVKERT